jgi:thiamine biosynthesis protein ThiI
MANQMGQLDQDRTYLLYCERGVQTAHLAELMQRKGFEAYSFRGGLRKLRSYADGQRRKRAGRQGRSDASTVRGR